MYSLNRKTICLSVFLCITTFFLVASDNIPIIYGGESGPAFNFEICVNIRELSINEYTTRIDTNIQIRNASLGSDTISVEIQDIEDYEITLMKTASGDYEGSAGNVLWYVRGVGEAFPYDYYILDFTIGPDSLEYSVENQTHELSEYVVTYGQGCSAEFTGVNRVRLGNTWNIEGTIDDSGYHVYLLRKSGVFYYKFIFPLYIVNLVIFLVPAFMATNIKNRSNNIRIYSSLLIFAIGYLFTIQSYLPPRNTLSLPEYFSSLIIIISSIMMLSSLLDIEPLNRRNFQFTADLLGYSASFIIYVVYTYLVYYPHRSSLQYINSTFLIIPALMVIGVSIRYFVHYYMQRLDT